MVNKENIEYTNPVDLDRVALHQKITLNLISLTRFLVSSGKAFLINNDVIFGCNYTCPTFEMSVDCWDVCTCGHDKYLNTQIQKWRKAHTHTIQCTRHKQAVCTCDFYTRQKKFVQSLGTHSLSCIVMKPNFKFKDFEIRWNSWIGRDMYLNKAITPSEWQDILQVCTNTLDNVMLGE